MMREPKFKIGDTVKSKWTEGLFPPFVVNFIDKHEYVAILDGEETKQVSYNYSENGLGTAYYNETDLELISGCT